MKKNQCCPSQLRYDVVSKDWVVIAPGRGKRPEEYKRQRKIIEMDLRQCPFCNLTEAADPLLVFSAGKIAAKKTLPGDWTLAVIPNKFPAFYPITEKSVCQWKIGPVYRSMDAVGFCEVVVTRDHDCHLGLMDLPATEEVMAAYQTRYLELKEKGIEASYEEILHNIEMRDQMDLSRTISPLRKADDAIELDNGRMSIEEQDAWLEARFNEAVYGKNRN